MPFAEDRDFLRRALESSIRIGLVLFLVVWCYQIARPFLPPIVWGIILAIATQPIYAALCRAMGGRTSKAEAGTLQVSPPPAGVADWPIVGEQVHAFWEAASENLEAALDPLHPQLKAVGRWALEAGTSAGLGIVVFALSLVLAGVLLAAGEPAAEAARRVAERLVPERGAELVALAGGTVLCVPRGVLGTAFIQAFLAGIGLLAAGVPAAGLWALLVLLLAVVQVPTLLVLVPIIVWVFASKSIGVAVLFGIWGTAVGLSDNVLKPLLLGRGSSVPTVVIFIGAIGGFLRAGIIGLFVGAVVLAVGYDLFKWWLEKEPETGQS
jgi:predicted PurR-regulated permease PerM